MGMTGKTPTTKQEGQPINPCTAKEEVRWGVVRMKNPEKISRDIEDARVKQNP